MPILTKNETPTKGQKAEFQLDKAALAALSSVSSDIYFSDMTNWNQVELVYVSPVGRQRKVVKFDATQATPVGVFFASLKAKNDFQIQYIMINDFDGGEFKINRSELTVAEFDIDMGGPTTSITRTFTTPLQSYDNLYTNGEPPIAVSQILPPLLELSVQVDQVSLFGEAFYELDTNALSLAVPENTDYVIEIYFDNASSASGSMGTLVSVSFDTWVYYETPFIDIGSSPLVVPFNRGAAAPTSGWLSVRAATQVDGASATFISLFISQIIIRPALP